MVMGVKQFEKLFREAASLDIDKSDIKRLDDFVNERLHDLLLLAQSKAKANGRPVIDWIDVPVTKGLQENIHEFRKMDEELSVSEILDSLSKLPPMDLSYSDELEKKIPEITGGITVSLAKVFKTVDPHLKNPGTEEWEKVEQIYQILL
jgi:hypothetical protein